MSGEERKDRESATCVGVVDKQCSLSAFPVCLRSSPLDSPAAEDADENNEGVLKKGKSRYEAYYEGQGQGGKEGAIDTTAVDDEG